MARYRVQGPDGAVHVFEGPDDATPGQVEEFAAQTFGAYPEPAQVRGAARPVAAVPAPEQPGIIASTAAGLGRGVGTVALGAQNLAGKGIRAAGNAVAGAPSLSELIAGPQQNLAQRIGQWLVTDAQQGRGNLDAELAPYKAENPVAAGIGNVGGEILATLPVGGVLAKPVAALAAKIPALAPLAAAIASGGAAAPGANFATRMAGGAVTGGASAALAGDEGSAPVGAAIGAAMPVVGKVAGYLGDVAVKAVRPFFKTGQESAAGDALRKFATNPAAAEQAMRGTREVVPGSAPTAAMAAGDEGIAGLARTVANQPGQAAELQARQYAQNAARTSAMERQAGTPGSIAAAQDARDVATGPMREAALAAAGKLDAAPIIAGIQRMMADPNNAGQTARAGLQRVLSSVQDIAGESGKLDARALYEIRKDIGLAMNGKLQGEAGNLRYARGTLDRVQNMIDAAIQGAINRVPKAPGTALMTPGANIALPGGAQAGPAPSWKGYLDEYARQSVPINQMETLGEVFKRISTGTVDNQGNAVLSAAKLNQLLLNDGKDLRKTLAPDQLDLLRRLRADLNASQLASSAGKAVGSNTVQNLASADALSGALGAKLAGSSPIASTIGRSVDWLYKKPNERILEELGAAMMDPKRAAMLMEKARTPGAIGQLFNASGAPQIPYRAAPLLFAQ